MAPSVRKDRIRESWEPRQLGGAPARAWLIIRRTVATLIAVALIGICGWILIRMLSRTDTLLAYWTATTYGPTVGQPLAYAYHDFKAIEPLALAFSTDEPKFIDPLKDPLTKKSLEARLAWLADGVLDDRETLILCITAHGVVEENEANLICEPGDTGNRYPISTLLEALKKLPGKTKLLILDAGRDNYISPFNTQADTFLTLLQREVTRLNDPNLWVLSANAPLERSHTSPYLGRSVFGYILSKGLSEAADGDSDGHIRLDELYKFVQYGVAEWVNQATSDNETQTPLLLHADPKQLELEQLDDRILLAAKTWPSARTETAASGENEAALAPGVLAASQLREASENATEQIGFVAANGGGDQINLEGETEGGNRETEVPTTVQSNLAATQDAENNSNTPEYYANAQRLLTDALKQLNQLEGIDAQLNPGVLKPWQWRRLVERVVWCEHCRSVGIPANDAKKWAQVINELKGVHNTLREFSVGIKSPISSEDLLVNDPTDEYMSLAMAEQIAKHRPNEPQSKATTDFAKSYDAWLESNAATSFAKLDAILPENKERDEKSLVSIETQKKFFELQLLAELRLHKNQIPWDLVRLILKTRRDGEKAAADLLCAAGWAQDKVFQADSARLRGERLILDRTNSDWPKLAKEHLEEAAARYKQAIDDLEQVRKIEQRRNFHLLRAPDYVRWAHIYRGAQDASHDNIAAIKNLFTQIRLVNEALATPAPQSFEILPRLDDQLQRAQEVVDDRLKTADIDWRSGNQREFADIESNLMESFNPNTSSVRPRTSKASKQQHEELEEQLNLELELARLGGYGENTDLRKREELFDKLSIFYAQLPVSIASLIESSDLRDETNRRPRLALLRGKMCDWLLLGTQGSGELDAKHNLVTALTQAAWYDLFRWQVERFRRAEIDAPVAEVKYLRGLAAAFARLSKNLPGPTVEALDEPSLEFVAATNRVSLLTGSKLLVPFNVRSKNGRPYTLVAQFDNERLKINGLASSDSADYPVDSNHPAMRATPQQGSAGEPKPFAVTLERTANARETTKLILKAISDGSIVRHEVDVELPGRELLELTVDAQEEVWWERTADGLRLFPLPSHDPSFPFRVRNLDDTDKKVEVAFWVPRKMPQSDELTSLPTGALEKRSAVKIRNLFDSRPLGSPISINLPASGESGLEQPEASDSQPPQQDGTKATGVPLPPYGLLATLTHGDMVLIRRIQVTPQRPRMYLNATASYDSKAARLQINIKAKSPNIIPLNGIKLSAQIEGAAAQDGYKPTGLLTQQKHDDVLTATIADNAPQVIAAQVSVDGSPRAFTFRIRRNADDNHIPPLEEASVRVVRLQESNAYKAEDGKVPIELQVDAPEGSFKRDGSHVEVGIDDERNDRLDDDPVVRLFSDRQVTVTAKNLSPDGTLSLNTDVKDFRLNLPMAGVMNKPVWLLGRLVIGGQATPSKERVEVILDGAGPDLYVSDVDPDSVEVDSEVAVHVRVRGQNPELSGVKKVEAVFQTITAGTEPQEVKWEKAVEHDNEWTVTLKTEKLGAKTHTVLIRAEDNVGNWTDPLVRQSIEVIPKKIATASPPVPVQANVSNTISGVTFYDTQPAQAKVTLVLPAGAPVASKDSDNTGQFTFTKVPPGEYVLKARSLAAIRNKHRQAEYKITVLPSPQRMPLERVKLE